MLMSGESVKFKLNNRKKYNTDINNTIHKACQSIKSQINLRKRHFYYSKNNSYKNSFSLS